MADSEYRYTGAHQAFRFDPDPVHQDVLIHATGLKTRSLKFSALPRQTTFPILITQNMWDGCPETVSGLRRRRGNKGIANVERTAAFPTKH